MAQVLHTDAFLPREPAVPPPEEAAIEGKWSPRQTLRFVVGSSLALWGLIGLAVWSIF